LELLVFDPFVNSNIIEKAGGKSVDLETVLKNSDFISLHTAVTQETSGMINRERLAMMKPTAYLINTARGALIDEGALLEALIKRRIAGAALDVLVMEPMGIDHSFRKLDNLTITPHIGGASEDIRIRHSRMIAEDIVRFLKGEVPLHLVNPEVLES